MTSRYIQAPATAGPARRLALAAAEVAHGVPGVAYLSPGVRGGDARRTRRHRDPAAGVTVTTHGTGWHIRIHLAVYEGHRVAAVAGAVRHAVGHAAADRDLFPTRTPVAVGVVVTAVLAAPR